MKKDFFKKIVSIFGKCVSILMGVLLLMLNISVFRANILPVKYLVLFVSFSVVLLLVFALFLWKENESWFKLCSSLISILVSIICVFGINYLNATNEFISSFKPKENEKIQYNVISMKSMNYGSINSLKNEVIGMLDENSDNVIGALSNVIYFSDAINKDISSLVDGLLDYSYKAIVVDNDVMNMIISDNEDIDFKSITNILYTFEVDTKVSNKEIHEVDIDEKPFVVYISGIDQYGTISTVRGRSDVNILFVANPKTHKILLVNTPRDYYVQLHGKVGFKDKLTHAGVYGIDMSMSTLEDLYNLNIDYYLRINFDTLVNVVDVIGGVEVESDTTFNSSHLPGWTVQKGVNYLDGKKALAYSRERYAYITGDRHRGKNQEDVITAILKKVSKSKVLLTKYEDVLESLQTSFQTNIPSNTIRGFIKYQLNEMPSWKVESISVSGSDASEYTYSYGTRQKLYVMVPYENDVNMAKNRINEVLNGK